MYYTYLNAQKVFAQSRNLISEIINDYFCKALLFILRQYAFIVKELVINVYFLLGCPESSCRF